MRLRQSSDADRLAIAYASDDIDRAGIGIYHVTSRRCQVLMKKGRMPCWWTTRAPKAPRLIARYAIRRDPCHCRQYRAEDVINWRMEKRGAYLENWRWWSSTEYQAVQVDEFETQGGRAIAASFDLSGRLHR